jgi:dihydroorotate dehydrogenase (NAD+) catalytic subunit
MSGPAVRAIALAQVAEVRSRVSIPIVGMGGVQNGRHAYDFIHAGADVVAVGTESFRDPLAGARVAAELAEIPANSGIPGTTDGSAREPIAHNA